MSAESPGAVQLTLVRAEVPVFHRDRLVPFEWCVLEAGQELWIGPLPGSEVLVPHTDALHLGGRKSYRLTRTAEGACRLQHTGHIGVVSVGGLRLTGIGPSSCEVPLGEELLFFSATGPLMLVLRLEAAR